MPRGTRIALGVFWLIIVVAFGSLAYVFAGPFVWEIWLSQTSKAVALTIARSEVYTREDQGRTAHISCQVRSYIQNDEQHWVETRIHSEACLKKEVIPVELARGQVVTARRSALNGGYTRKDHDDFILIAVAFFLFVLVLAALDRLIRLWWQRTRRK